MTGIMSKKILIVDDEEDMLFAVKLQLEQSGFTVLTAQDGKTGLDMARTQKPDLVILDLMLPKLDGYKVCRMLKFDQKYKYIPVILFTARVQYADAKLGYEVGADAYITKPFDPNVLLEKIQELTERA